MVAAPAFCLGGGISLHLLLQVVCCQAMAIARPATTAEVSEVLRLCHAAGQPVVTHGGLTGLVHGAKAVAEHLKEQGVEPSSAELTWVAQNEIKVEGSDAEKVISLLEALEDLDDVQKVHTNADIDEAILAEAG